MIPFQNREGVKPVSEDRMREVYERMKTPVKLGRVMSMKDRFADCCGVFSFEN